MPNVSSTHLAKKFLFLFIPVFILQSLIFAAFEYVRVQVHIVEVIAKEDSHMALGKNSIARDLENLGSDLMLLTNYESLARLMLSNTAENRNDLVSRYKNFALDRIAYTKIGYINENGQEIIRILYNGDTAKSVPLEHLQNKQNQLYFQKAFAKSKGEVFVSRLDLYTQNNRASVPYKPIIRLSTPIFDKFGRKRGIIVIDYKAQKLFDHFSDSMPGNINDSFILNKHGNLLFSSTQKSTWGFLFSQTKSFSSENPDVWKKINAKNTGNIETKKGIYAFTTIDPKLYILSMTKHQSIAPRLPSPSHEWKIISFIPKEKLEIFANWHKHLPDVITFIFFLIISAAGSWYLALARYKQKRAEYRLKEKIKTALFLEKIAATANAATTPSAAMQNTLDLLCAYIQWPVGHMYTVNEETTDLFSTDMWHLDDPNIFEPFRQATLDNRFKYTVGLPGRVMASKKTEWIADISRDKNFPRALIANKVGLNSAFAFPIIVESKTIAVMEFFTTDFVNVRPKIINITAHISTHIGRVVERDLARQEIIRIKRHAEKANLTKSQFLASMSHELRTPLNAVLGFAQMLQFDPIDHLTSSQNEYVESIIAGGNHLLELVNEILDLAKIEADQMPLHLEKIDATEIVKSCVDLSSPLAQAKGISIIDTFSNGPSSFLRTDAMRFKQSILNLLSNAIKYNTTGGTVTIHGCENDDGFLRLSVTDTGIGIAEQDFDNVFEMFHRFGGDAMIAHEGTGIGLAVTKLLVEHMAGKIGFESQLDKGSTFWIILPLASNKSTLIWTDTLRVGIDPIDKDHQILFSLLNKISHHSISDSDLENAISELLDYTVFHFKREETVMKACGYPDLKTHKKLHSELAAKASELAVSWHDDHDPNTLSFLKKFLREWLIEHIMKSDVDIFQYAKGNEQTIYIALKELNKKEN